jgi:alpha-aminoadipate carrier protein LysW
MATTKNSVMAVCPDCEEEINVGSHPRQGQHVTCPECWADLEIISLDPLELDFAAEDDDWDDEA